MKKTILINLFGGPGISKSTTATGIFSLLKMHDIDCEYIPEFAKELVWENRHKTLKNQIYIFSKQYHRLWRLHGEVDVMITDSPLLFSLIYPDDNETENFPIMIKKLFDCFNNLNFLLTRIKKYNPNGRNQTEEEAKLIDQKILNMLNENNIKYKPVIGNTNAVNVIVNKILGLLHVQQKYIISMI